MLEALNLRTVVIGNSGSGKSTLAASLSARLSVPAVDLDTLHWDDSGYGRKRDETDARQLTAEVAAGQRWIIEGVYGWLAEVALPRATALIWLDIPWEQCRAGLLERGPRWGSDPDQFAALLAWAEAYGDRTTSSSLTGHRRIYEAFAGPKLRLRSRDETLEFVERL